MDSLASSSTPNTRPDLEHERILLGVIETRILEGNVELPPLPRIALKVRELIDADGEVKEIAAALEQDAGYAAPLLRYANSVAFAGLTQVVDLPSAVRHHHDPAFGPEDTLSAIVACADRVASKLGVSLRPDSDTSLLECAAAEFLDLDDAGVATLLGDVADDIAHFKES